jgi:hypothetical protein
MAGDTPMDVQFQRIDLFTRAESTMTLAVDYETPRGRSNPLALTAAPPAGLDYYWDVGTWDVTDWSVSAVEVHDTMGVSGTGRWIAPRLSHASVGERFGFLKWRVTGVPAGDSPAIP